MLTNFEKMPSNARLWVYQAERTLTNEEKMAFEDATMLFINQWTAHQSTLNASFVIKYNHFLIIAVDESAAQASGCSIDKLTHFLKNLESEFQISLLGRLQIAFCEENDKGNIMTFALKDVRNALENGKINAKTLYFNNSVDNLADFEKSWLLPIEQTWLKQKLINVVTI